MARTTMMALTTIKNHLNHRSYDHSRNLGRAVRIKVYIGYNGKASICSTGVQYCRGAEIVTTADWMEASEETSTSSPMPRPRLKNQETLGIVGYPADKSYSNELGAQMYEEYDATNYNLSAAQNNMLEYTISTYAGAKIVKSANNISYVLVPVASTIGGADSSVLNVAAPFLSPVGGPAVAFAGAALSFAGSIGDANLGGAESAIPVNNDYKGFIQRGILAESALSTILDLPMGKYMQLGLNEKLKEAYNNAGPFVHGLGPRILPVVMQPVATVGLDAHRKEHVKYERLKKNEPESSASAPQKLQYPALPEATEVSVADFLTRMWADTVETADEVLDKDWFFKQLGNVIYDGVLNGRTCTNYAPSGLNLLSSIAAAKGTGFPQSDTDSQLHVLSLRAMLGEAALQRLISSDHDKLQEEGYFDTIKYAQDIGRQAMADWVMPRVTPIVLQLLRGQTLPPPGAGDAGNVSGGNSVVSQANAAPR
ncbi:hypothetical protein MFIFM68171_10180 [Madurella fahalii]|uniref:Uncharacterized protein n=1 Tax=Madurella fahalii TaxID=1157608 RepID=A0ABQ0GQF6_9PEZI